MKRFFYSAIALFIFLLLVTVCCQDNTDEGNLGQRLSWTFMFYDDADFQNAFDPWDDFISRMYSADNLHVLVLRDREGMGGGIYYINPDMSYTCLEAMATINMGDPATLANFINRAKIDCPADRYSISFYDHGGGYMGACSDQSHNDWLDMYEIKEGLAAGGGVDLVLFSAPCLMGAIESMYEVRHQTEVYIGSEHLSGYVLWRYPMKDIRETLVTNPAITNLDLATEIISFIKGSLHLVDNQYPGTSKIVTMSAVQSDKLDELVTLFNEISNYYSSNPQKFKKFMDEHYQDIETYGNFNMDLYSLSGWLIQYETDQTIISKLTNLQNKINQAVIAELHGDDFPDTHGIAIHHPNKAVFEFYNSEYQKVEFATATKWAMILTQYFGYPTTASPSLNGLIERLMEISPNKLPEIP